MDSHLQREMQSKATALYREKDNTMSGVYLVSLGTLGFSCYMAGYFN